MPIASGGGAVARRSFSAPAVCLIQGDLLWDAVSVDEVLGLEGESGQACALEAGGLYRRAMAANPERYLNEYVQAMARLTEWSTPL